MHNVRAFKKPEPAPLTCPGVGRDVENPKALVFSFNRPLADAEIRFLHEVMQRAVALMPEPTDAA